IARDLTVALDLGRACGDAGAEFSNLGEQTLRALCPAVIERETVAGRKTGAAEIGRHGSTPWLWMGGKRRGQPTRSGSDNFRRRRALSEPADATEWVAR